MTQATGSNLVTGPYWNGVIQGLTIGATYDLQIAARGISGTERVNFHLEGNASNVVQLSTAWQLLRFVGTYTGSGALVCYTGGDIGDGIEFAFPGIYEQGEGGVSIPTDTAPVTLTDYTLSGSTVSFGEAPADGATCDWTGVARR